MKHVSKLIISLALTWVAAAPVVAQNPVGSAPPDLEAIEREVNDPASTYYYPRLMEEYMRADTLMTADRFQRLYYGYIFQEDYNPYRAKGLSEGLREAYTRPRLERKMCDTVIRDAEKALLNDPFDLPQIVALIAALRMKGKNNLAHIWQYKLNGLLTAIVSSGTGADEDNAWMVTEPQHEDVLLYLMGFSVKEQLLCEPCYEYITVRDAEGKDSGGFYFNIGAMLDEYYRKHPEE